VRKWLRQKWEPQRWPVRGRALDRWEDFLRGRAPEVGFNATVLREVTRGVPGLVSGVGALCAALAAGAQKR
jgi:hypothetical protein